MKLIALYQILDVKEFYIFIIILKCVLWYRSRDYTGQMLWREPRHGTACTIYRVLTELRVSYYSFSNFL